MARSVFDFTSSKNEEELNEIAKKMLLSNGFEFTLHNGEEIFKKETAGGMVVPQFIKLEIKGNKVHIQAFIKSLIGESPLTGIWGIAAKKPLKNFVEQLMALLK